MRLLGTIECDDNMIQDALRAFLRDMFDETFKVEIGDIKRTTDGNGFPSWKAEIIDVPEDSQGGD